LRLEKEKQEREKEEEKRERRAAREAVKKANELKKLKQDIYTNFVEKGEHRENILNQDLIEIDGMNLRAPCVGSLGGMLGQMIICFHAVHRHWK